MLSGLYVLTTSGPFYLKHGVLQECKSCSRKYRLVPLYYFIYFKPYLIEGFNEENYMIKFYCLKSCSFGAALAFLVLVSLGITKIQFQANIFIAIWHHLKKRLLYKLWQHFKQQCTTKCIFLRLVIRIKYKHFQR